jgi:hypothetical protein
MAAERGLKCPNLLKIHFELPVLMTHIKGAYRRLHLISLLIQEFLSFSRVQDKGHKTFVKKRIFSRVLNISTSFNNTSGSVGPIPKRRSLIR